jgi:hypothetical protein
MKSTYFKSAVFASMTALSVTLIAAPAHADIEDWLRRNFSTNDFIGDWLRDTFTPIHNSGEEGGFQSPSIKLKGYKEAVLMMAKWPKNEGAMPKVVQVCTGEKLLAVILETKSQKKTTATCFKQP